MDTGGQIKGYACISGISCAAFGSRLPESPVLQVIYVFTWILNNLCLKGRNAEDRPGGMVGGKTR
jgi:hypothetical protein